ncbi:MAG: hypothetical protein KBC88_06180 [Alphaproteobacteria bacterium]|nr:hypothetical protein [Alphaproteobacteria bacterium]
MEPDVNPFEGLAPALREAFEGASEAPERVDSSVAIKRMVEGPQQFTFLRDTNHSKYAIRRALREAIPAMVEAGAKHLFLEPAIYPKEHPLHSEDDVELADVMERLSSKPPRITSAEIRRQSYRFETVHVDKDLPEEEREEAQKQTGIEYAELLIEARNRGFTVHMAGDDLGKAESLEAIEISQEHERYRKEREILLTHGLAAADENDEYPLGDKMFFDMQQDALDRFLEARSGEWSEAKRAQRFVDMAGGEKAVVVFGAGHGLLGAALDSELRRRAYEDGQGEPEKTKVLNIWESRGAAASWEEKHPKTKYDTPPDAVLYVKEGEMEMLPAPSASPASPVLAAAPPPPPSGR